MAKIRAGIRPSARGAARASVAKFRADDPRFIDRRFRTMVDTNLMNIAQAIDFNSNLRDPRRDPRPPLVPKEELQEVAPRLSTALSPPVVKQEYLPPGHAYYTQQGDQFVPISSSPVTMDLSPGGRVANPSFFFPQQPQQLPIRAPAPAPAPLYYIPEPSTSPQRRLLPQQQVVRAAPPAPIMVQSGETAEDFIFPPEWTIDPENLQDSISYLQKLGYGVYRRQSTIDLTQFESYYHALPWQAVASNARKLAPARGKAKVRYRLFDPARFATARVPSSFTAHALTFSEEQKRHEQRGVLDQYRKDVLEQLNRAQFPVQEATTVVMAARLKEVDEQVKLVPALQQAAIDLKNQYDALLARYQSMNEASRIYNRSIIEHISAIITQTQQFHSGSIPPQSSLVFNPQSSGVARDLTAQLKDRWSEYLLNLDQTNNNFLLQIRDLSSYIKTNDEFYKNVQKRSQDALDEQKKLKDRIQIDAKQTASSVQQLHQEHLAEHENTIAKLRAELSQKTSSVVSGALSPESSSERQIIVELRKELVDTNKEHEEAFQYHQELRREIQEKGNSLQAENDELLLNSKNFNSSIQRLNAKFSKMEQQLGNKIKDCQTLIYQLRTQLSESSNQIQVLLDWINSFIVPLKRQKLIPDTWDAKLGNLPPKGGEGGGGAAAQVIIDYVSANWKLIQDAHQNIVESGQTKWVEQSKSVELAHQQALEEKSKRIIEVEQQKDKISESWENTKILWRQREGEHNRILLEEKQKLDVQESENQELRSELDKATQLTKEGQSQTSKTAKQFSTLQLQMSDLHNKNEEQTKIVEQLRSLVFKLGQEKKDWFQSADEYKTIISRLENASKETIFSLQQQNQALNQQSFANQQKLAEYVRDQEQINLMSKERAQERDQENYILQQQLEGNIIKTKKLNDSLSLIQDHYNQSLLDLEQIQIETENLTQKLEFANSSLEKLSAERFSRMQSQSTEHQKANEQTLMQIHQIENERDALRSQLKKADEKESNLQTQIVESNALVDELETKKGELEKRIALCESRKRQREEPKELSPDESEKMTDILDELPSSELKRQKLITELLPFVKSAQTFPTTKWKSDTPFIVKEFEPTDIDLTKKHFRYPPSSSTNPFSSEVSMTTHATTIPRRPRQSTITEFVNDQSSRNSGSQANLRAHQLSSFIR